MLNEIKPRLKELQKIWKPIGLIAFIVSLLEGVREFHHRSGEFFTGSLLLFALSVVILYTIPIKSIRLLADRLVSFVLDLIILALLTYAVVDLLFKFQVLEPSAALSMTIVWGWFLVFVLCDWRFGGTPGKLILGLRLKDVRSRGRDFIRCFLRSLLTLVVPLAIAGRITAILTHSTIASYMLWAIALCLLSFLPLSIAFSGGQSIPDLLLGTAVLPSRVGFNQCPANLNRRDWLLLAVVSFLTGVVLAYTSFPGLGGRTYEFKPPEFPITQVTRSGEAEARIAAGLRSHVLSELPNSVAALEDFRVISVLGDPPGAATGETPAALACRNSINLNRGYLIVHAKINPQTPTVVKAVLFKDLIGISRLAVGRPGYLVLEISITETFGVFDFESSEAYVLCLTESNGKPEGTLVGAQGTITLPYSLQLPALLMLGDLERYSTIEKVPVWPIS
jgi:hypothetical protein